LLKNPSLLLQAGNNFILLRFVVWTFSGNQRLANLPEDGIFLIFFEISILEILPQNVKFARILNCWRDILELIYLGHKFFPIFQPMSK